MLKLASFAALAVARPSILTQEDGAAPAADIKFKTYPLAGTSLSFGIALPTAATGKNDFVGQITGTGIGWGGIGLGPSMTKYILIVAEPSGSTVTGSLHKTNVRTYPPPYSAAGVTLSPIASGTFAKDGSWQYTFVCTGCLADSANFTQTSDSAAIAWAYSSSPKLNYHTKTGHAPLAGLSGARTDGYAAAASSAS